jgi:hypothetical protein
MEDSAAMAPGGDAASFESSAQAYGDETAATAQTTGA